MRVILHQIKLSPYSNEPPGVRIIPPPLVLIGWRFECFRGQNFPIMSLDDLVDLTKGSLPNHLDLAVDEPFTWGRSFTGCFSQRFAV